MQWHLKRTFRTDMQLNLSLNRLKISWADFLKQSWLTEAAREQKALLELILKYQDQEKVKPLTRKQETESGSEEDHRLNQ